MTDLEKHLATHTCTPKMYIVSDCCATTMHRRQMLNGKEIFTPEISKIVMDAQPRGPKTNHKAVEKYHAIRWYHYCDNCKKPTSFKVMKETI